MTKLRVTTSILKAEKQITSILLFSKQETCFLCCLRRWRLTPFLNIQLENEVFVDESNTTRVFPTCHVTVEEEEVARLDTDSKVMIKLMQGNQTINRTTLDVSHVIEALQTRHQYDEDTHLFLDICQYSPLTVTIEVRFESLTDDTVSDLSSSCSSQQESVTNEEEVQLECSVRRRIPFLTLQQLEDATEDGQMLGQGTYGEVRLVMYEGEMVVMKSLMPPATTASLLQETKLLLDLDGAGGMPRAQAVCLELSAILLEYVGHTYDEFLQKCSVGGLIDSLTSIAGRLEELHDRGIVHNDLKANNITFSGSLDSPVFHIIDCGIACQAGQVVDCYIPEGDEDLYPWLGPEVQRQEPVFPSHDVFSLGALIDVALQTLETDVPPQVAEELQLLADACRETQPSDRPSLEVVGVLLGLVKKELALISSVPVWHSATITSQHQQAASYTQTHWASSTSFHREVASAPGVLCRHTDASFLHVHEGQDPDW